MAAGGGLETSMRENAEELEDYLKRRHGDAVNFTFVDVNNSSEIKRYPGIAPRIGDYTLPLTLVNGVVAYQGGLPSTTISNVVREHLK